MTVQLADVLYLNSCGALDVVYRVLTNSLWLLLCVIYDDNNLTREQLLL